jgi:UDP-2-acetamido-2,6-beta-L-arabino-hexul-4-ose reductase
MAVGRIVLTGADGFLGRHLRARLLAAGVDSVVCLSRLGFGDDGTLSRDLVGADAVVHLAGVNRGQPDDVERANEALARRLAQALRTSGGTPRLIYANSVHAGDNTPYGRGKQRASSVFAGWAHAADAAYVDVILPNVFGESGQPDYNSFVATFCHRLASGEPPEVDVDRPIELLHAQDAADFLLDHLAQDSPTGAVSPKGTPTTVGEVLARLADIDATYRAGLIPDLTDAFELRLFNTYRSYLYPHGFPRPLTEHRDFRGLFVETAKSLGGQAQASISSTGPGVTRGNHFHLRKFERFVVVGGRARLALRPVWSRESFTYEVSGEAPALVDIPTLHTHNITNVGDDELWTTFWANEIYDPAQPDTYAEVV